MNDQKRPESVFVLSQTLEKTIVIVLRPLSMI